jgi:hypothetical protein
MKERKSMRGVSVDLGKLMSQQEKNIAVGNTKSNARGDQLGRAGRVIKSADDLAREHYNRNNPNAVKNTTLKTDDYQIDMDAKLAEARKAAAAEPKDDWEEPSVEENKQTKASKKDAEATQKNVESVGTEKEQESSGTETENNSQDIEEQQQSVEEDEWVEDAEGNFVRKSELENDKPVSKSKTSRSKSK